MILFIWVIHFISWDRESLSCDYLFLLADQTPRSYNGENLLSQKTNGYFGGLARIGRGHFVVYNIHNRFGEVGFCRSSINPDH